MTVCVSLAAGKWSCSPLCDRAKEELINYSTSEGSLFVQKNNIIDQYCQELGVESAIGYVNCRRYAPDFWGAIALRLWPEAWSHLCDDIEETCESGLRLSCRECELNIDLALETLRDPLITDYWVQELRQSNFCDVNYSGLQRVCDGYLKDLFPELLLVSTGRDWVPTFCSDFGCKP